MSESSYPQRTPSGVAHETGATTSGLPSESDPTVTPPVGSTTHHGSTAQQAAGHASDVASHAGGAAKDLAHETGQKAGEVAGEAKERARDLAWQAREELRGQATVQQQRVAVGLRAFGDELAQMAGSSLDRGYAADLAERAGDLSRRAASWFEERDPGSVLTEVQDFARRRPGVFLAVAAGAGLLAGRLARGLKDADGTERPARWAAGPGVADSYGAAGTTYGTGAYDTSAPYGAGYESGSAYPTATGGVGGAPGEPVTGTSAYVPTSGRGTPGGYPATGDPLTGDPLTDELDVPTSPNRPWTGGADDVERP